MSLNGLQEPSGCTGRGRGLARGINARSRGRGICDAPPSELPGIGSLNLNGAKNGYKEDARTAFQNVISKPKNGSEVSKVVIKWLDLAETDEGIGEAVAEAVCELMSHDEYGDKIRAEALTRVYTMYEECLNGKVKSPTVLAKRFSFTGFMYLIQRAPETHKRFEIYEKPILLYIKELLAHKLTEDLVNVLTKQVAINGVVLHSTEAGREDLERIFLSIRQLLLADSTDSKLRPYLLFLCDLQAAHYQPLPQALLKLYSNYFTDSQLNSYRPLEIDVKLYGIHKF